MKHRNHVLPQITNEPDEDVYKQETKTLTTSVVYNPSTGARKASSVIGSAEILNVPKHPTENYPHLQSSTQYPHM